jgi:salicylate hydroxylase
MFQRLKNHTVALSRYPNIEVEIFEAAEKLAEIGAGIGLFPRK